MRVGFLWKEVERANISTFARAGARLAPLSFSLARVRAIETFLESADE